VRAESGEFFVVLYGCRKIWLIHLPWEQENVGSNPTARTLIYCFKINWNVGLEAAII